MLTDGQLLLVALFTQASFYGIYLATLVQCFRWLIFADEGWKLRQKINHIMTFATIFIFTMSTINLVTTLTFEINKYFTKGESWDSYSAVMVMNTTEVVGIISVDAVLIYRCWVVYAKSLRVICVPVTIWLASLACLILFSYFGGLNYKRQTFSLEIALIAMKTFTSLYACNIAITIYATTAIIYRILSTRQNSAGSPKRLNYIVRVLAESGILYTFTMVFSMVGMLVIQRDDASWVANLVIDIAEPLAFSMAGITFNLILIRVYRSRVELQDSMVYSRVYQNRVESRNTTAYSKDAYGMQNMSGTQCSNLRTPPPLSEGPSSSTLNQTMDEVQAHHRACMRTELGL